MSRKITSGMHWLTAAVLLHLTVSIAHGEAHRQAHVPLSQAATLFVIIIILIGPLVGLALTRLTERIGIWIIAITMSSAFVFGLVNHFVLVSQDHVAHVALQWRSFFALTAILVAGTELLGSGLAIRLARERKDKS